MPSGGIIGYFGYEYQFFATTLLMLDAHGVKHESFKLSVETLFGEDAELEQKKVRILNFGQVINDTVVQVQVKTKQQTQHWRPADIRELLLKSDESIDNGKTVLDKLYSTPNSTFLFVTDGSIAENLAGLLSEKIGTPQHKYGEEKLKNIRKAIISSDRIGRHKNTLTRKLTKNVLARIFIIANLSLEDIERRIRESLLWDYGIPTYQVYEKTEALAGIIRECARRKNGKAIIVNSDVTEIIGTAEVKLPNQEVELLYQKTDEYDLAKRLLNQKHMVLLSGEPGSGKTTLAYKLANEQANQHYRFELIGGENSHLNILRACRGKDNIVFLLDDAFGYDDYKDSLGAALGNNFDQIILQLQQANGRVKVVITSRNDVITQVCFNTKLTTATLNNHLVSLPFSSHAFNFSVLKAHLNYLGVKSEINEEVIAIPLLSEKFENLHHIRAFTYSLIRLEEIPLQETLLSILEETKPTLYSKWIERQSPDVQLFLISLWLVSEVNQFASETDIKSMFNTLSHCISLPSTVGFSQPYNIALRDLQEKGRVLRRRGNIVDFIHPTLKRATAKFFENIIDKKDFVACVTNSLVELDFPLGQSIAVYLAITDLVGADQFEKLSAASKSKYVQVIDTVIRFGKPLLESGNPKTKQLAEDVFKAKFHPSECTINEEGHLVMPIYNDSVEQFIYSPSDLAEIFEWETIGFIPDKDPELSLKFQEHLAEKSFMLLNPLERYKFLDWVFSLHNSRLIESEELLSCVAFMSADPISFVRQRVAEHLGQLLDAPVVSSIIESLCYDSSPHVRIAMLEDVLLRYWVKQDRETQTTWLGLVTSMLNDTVVRLRCARGLVDQSGSLYYYHKDHTEEQKREWFEAVALKLLEYSFEVDDLDRFLAAFDKHYLHFQKGYRLSLLDALNKYIENNLNDATSIITTVDNILFKCNPSEQELIALLKLINYLPPIAKADFCFRFALNYEDLPDERFQEFVHRPFFIEDPEEMIFERTAGILGFLANPSDTKPIDRLPSPIGEMADEYLQAISKYVEKQSDEFKLITIFQAFGHEYSYYTSARYHSLYSHPLIKKLLHEFVVDKPQNPNTKIVANILLNDNYYRTEANHGQQTEWLEFIELLLSSKNVDLLKSVCDSLFQGNIDSSVHNIDDWLILLTRLLTHPILEVQSYTTSLYDQYFLDIWPDITIALHGEYNGQDKYLGAVWLNNDFFQQLLDNSPSFKEYIGTMFYLDEVVDNWDTFTKKEKDSHVSKISEIINEEKYYINSLVEAFLNRMKDKLRVKDKSKLNILITSIEGQYNHKTILGRTKYLESTRILRDQLPQFNWSKYVD